MRDLTCKDANKIGEALRDGLETGRTEEMQVVKVEKIGVGMTLDEAIEHIQDKLCCVMTDECRQEHIQLREWLLELKSYRENAKEGLER